VGDDVYCNDAWYGYRDVKPPIQSKDMLSDDDVGGVLVSGRYWTVDEEAVDANEDVELRVLKDV